MGDDNDPGKPEHEKVTKVHSEKPTIKERGATKKTTARSKKGRTSGGSKGSSAKKGSH